MTDVAIYAEGGGDSIEQRAELRPCFDGLLRSVKSKALDKGFGWKLLVPCGGRQKTYEAFMNALRTNAAALNVLLVDSEAPVASGTGDAVQDARAQVDHLRTRDGWDLAGAEPERVHLMVQRMEAWIVADAKSLEELYGQGFMRNALPKRPNLEEEPKTDLFDKLRQAKRFTQKGEYHKIKHAARLLERIDPGMVAKRCPRFAHLTRWLEHVIGAG